MSRKNAPVRPDDVVEVQIERLAQGGRGVARHEGFVLFVQRGLPGDTVSARVTRVRRSYAEAVVQSIVETGPHHVEAPCPYYGTCGGCAWQALDYPAQLAAKEDQIREAIERIAGAEGVEIAPIIPAVETLGYRNKMEYTFMEEYEIDEEFPENPPLSVTMGLGFHMLGRWDQLVNVDPCLIADPRGIPAHRIAVKWANEFGMRAYDRDTAEGSLRNLVVRVGRNTGEVLVHLITGPGKLPRIAELVDELEVGVPGLVGVLHSTNGGSAEVAAGDKESGGPAVLWGRDWFEEQLAGERLIVRPDSFLQTNTATAETMYSIVRDMAVLREDDVAYDLYCGIGSIALMLARHVSHVVGVEVVAEAIDCANENAKLNEIENVEFQVGNVRPILKAAKGVWPDPSLIVVDPPRSGLVQKVVRRVCELRPERIMYVSCNPSTFAGNLPWFAENGYQLVAVQPVDQFPHTHHVELVARLEPIPGWQPPVEEEVTAKKKK